MSKDGKQTLCHDATFLRPLPKKMIKKRTIPFTFFETDGAKKNKRGKGEEEKVGKGRTTASPKTKQENKTKTPKKGNRGKEQKLASSRIPLSNSFGAAKRAKKEKSRQRAGKLPPEKAKKRTTTTKSKRQRAPREKQNDKKEWKNRSFLMPASKS